MVLAATLAVGNLLLGELLEGGLYLAATICGAVMIWPELRRETRGPPVGCPALVERAPMYVRISRQVPG